MASSLLPIWAATGVIVAPDATKISVGWLLGEKPPHEYMNWWQSQMVDRTNHILANGVPQWEATKTYAVDTLTLRAGILYRCLTANSNSTPPSANWLRVTQDAGALVTGTLANARLNAATYNNFVTILGTGSATFSAFIASGASTGFRGNELDSADGPSFGWGANGMFHATTNTIAWSTAGVERMRLSATGALSVVGSVAAASFVGSGAALESLNADNLSSGIVPKARLLGGIYDVAILDAGTVRAATGGSVAAPAYGFTGAGAGAGVFANASGTLIATSSDGTARLALGPAGEAVFTGRLSGNGSGLFGLVNLNASELTAGFVPNARINGSYTGFGTIEGVGGATFRFFQGTNPGLNFRGSVSDTAVAPSFGWGASTGMYLAGADTIGWALAGVAKASLGSDGLTLLAGQYAGAGGLLTGLESTALVGTIPIGRLPVATSARDWVLGRVADGAANAIGTHAFATRDAGSAAVLFGGTAAGSTLTPSSSEGRVSGGTMSGTWRCLGRAESTEQGARVTLWLRIA